MNDVIKLLKAIALSENPQAEAISFEDGSFWVHEGEDKEGLFCNETNDVCFAKSLGASRGWCIAIERKSAPSREQELERLLDWASKNTSYMYWDYQRQHYSCQECHEVSLDSYEGNGTHKDNCKGNEWTKNVERVLAQSNAGV